MNILGLDLGPEHSAYCWLNSGEIGSAQWVENETVLAYLLTIPRDDFTLVMESPQAQDRPLGRMLRDTIILAGRVIEICSQRQIPLIEADERDVALWLTGNRSAGNPAVLQALKDQFGDKRDESCLACEGRGRVRGVRGERNCFQCKGRGFKTVPGPLPTNEHVRSALGAALWHWKRSESRRERAAEVA